MIRSAIAATQRDCPILSAEGHAHFSPPRGFVYLQEAPKTALSSLSSLSLSSSVTLLFLSLFLLISFQVGNGLETLVYEAEPIPLHSEVTSSL